MASTRYNFSEAVAGSSGGAGSSGEADGSGGGGVEMNNVSFQQRKNQLKFLKVDNFEKY